MKGAGEVEGRGFRQREQHRQARGQRTAREGLNQMRAPGALSKVVNKETTENGPEGCGPSRQRL